MNIQAMMKQAQKLQNDMIKKLDIINMKYFTNHSKGEILNIVNGDIKLLAEFGTWLSQAILLFLSFIISIIIIKTSLKKKSLIISFNSSWLA